MLIVRFIILCYARNKVTSQSLKKKKKCLQTSGIF